MGVREFIHESRYILGGWLIGVVLAYILANLFDLGVFGTSVLGGILALIGIVLGMALELRVERKAGRQWP